jgi:hypothetical protein
MMRAFVVVLVLAGCASRPAVPLAEIEFFDHAYSFTASLSRGLAVGDAVFGTLAFREDEDGLLWYSMDVGTERCDHRVRSRSVRYLEFACGGYTLRVRDRGEELERAVLIGPGSEPSFVRQCVRYTIAPNGTRTCAEYADVMQMRTVRLEVNANLQRREPGGGERV